MNIPTAGHIYRHYKGGRYVVAAIATTHEHNGDVDVVYLSLTKGYYCTRQCFKTLENRILGQISLCGLTV